MKARSERERIRMLERLRAASNPDPGLCATCRHLETLESPRSVFVKCALSRIDPTFPRYPVLPVRACSGWSGADEADDPSG